MNIALILATTLALCCYLDHWQRWRKEYRRKWRETNWAGEVPPWRKVKEKPILPAGKIRTNETIFTTLEEVNLP